MEMSAVNKNNLILSVKKVPTCNFKLGLYKKQVLFFLFFLFFFAFDFALALLLSLF
jgi:hypothetical protein